MSETRRLLDGLLEPDDSPPPAVREAEADIRAWGLTLAIAGAFGPIWAVLLDQMALGISPWWLAVYLGLLIVLFHLPPARSLRKARAILRRWDAVEVEGALEAGGAASDPRVRIAEQMARRVVRHPTAEAAVKESAAELYRAIRRTAQDRRTLELVDEAARWRRRDDTTERSVSDALDFVASREGELLSSLEQLHRAVISRDADLADEIRALASSLLERARAEAELDRWLEGGDV